MKIRLTFVIVLLVVVSAGLAQRKSLHMDHENFFRFGGKAGLNINKVRGQSFSNRFSYNFQVGGFVQVNFSDRFGIQPEVNFVQSNATVTSDQTEIYDDIFGGGSQKNAALNLLEVPVLLNLNLGISKRIKLQLGPAYSAALGEKIEDLLVNTRIYKKSEWSAIGGIWFQLPLINTGIRYKHGLTNINGIDDREVWRNRSFQVFVGVTF